MGGRGYSCRKQRTLAPVKGPAVMPVSGLRCITLPPLLVKGYLYPETGFLSVLAAKLHVQYVIEAVS